MNDKAPPRRYLPGPAAWLVGVPLGLLLSAPLMALWGVAHPATLLTATQRALGEQDWRVLIDEATFDRGDGWTSPRSWRWRARCVAVVGQLPNSPAMLVDDVTVALPRFTWKADGSTLTLPSVHAHSFELFFDAVTERTEPPPMGEGGLMIVIEQLTVDHFGLSMQKGLNPEVMVSASDVALLTPLRARPQLRELTGQLSLQVADVEVAGVPVHKVHASRAEFTGRGFAATARGLLGDAVVDVELGVNPLIGRAKIDVWAHLHEGTLAGLARVILGHRDMQLLGKVEVTATLAAGGELAAGELRGTADVRVVEAGFARPESRRSALVLATVLTPFLVFDEAGDIIIGDLHGKISFTQRGVSFDTVIYEAPHSVGELRGYVRGSQVSAKLHFRPRPRSGAVEWGFVLRGDVGKPKIALALPSVLRAWTPCDDPANCPLGGGAPKAEPDAAAAKVTRASAADERQQERTEARDARRAERSEQHDAKQAAARE